MTRGGSSATGGGWILLTKPTEPAPAWPLGTLTEEEAALWADLWSRPPASLWPRFHLTRDVATYVRTLLAYERGGHSNASLGVLVARQADCGSPEIVEGSLCRVSGEGGGLVVDR